MVLLLEPSAVSSADMGSTGMVHLGAYINGVDIHIVNMMTPVTSSFIIGGSWVRPNN